MFRGSIIDGFSDEEATTVSQEHTTAQDAPAGAPLSAPIDQTASTCCPVAHNNQPLQLAARITRPPLFLADLPSQTMTPADIEEVQTASQAAQNRTYQPPRAAHTIQPIYPVHFNGFQSANATTSAPRAPSTPSQRAPSTSNAWRPTAPDPQTVARIALLPSLRPAMEVEEIKALLAPVMQHLEKLATTTIPPDNGRVASYTAMQVLNDRILPVGRHITQQLTIVEEDRRGATEMDVCRYIAEHHWPQDLVRVNALMVMEMCRNTIYLERIRHEHMLAQLVAESRRLRAEDEQEEEACRFEGLDDRFVDEWECEISVLNDEDMWASLAGGETWRSAPLLGEIMSELEIGDTDDEGGGDMAGEVPRLGYLR